jgi:ABC-type dipeptide/oligopeptide/nickel transport system permease component
MRTFIIRRLGLLIFVLLGVSILTFTISHVIPADPARQAAGPHATTEQVELLKKKFGFDKPLPEQYLIYMKGLLRGDFGFSLYSRRPVAEDIKTYFPATIELTIVAMLICLIFGIPLGVLSAVKKDQFFDHVSRVICIGGVGLPLFWLALLFQLVFYRWLDWLPAGGRISPTIAPPDTITGFYILDSLLTRNWEALRSSLYYIILPAITLAFASVAWVARITRSSMVEMLGQDYIRTARGKGLRERQVIYLHALRNALIPSVTMIGLQTGALLAGAFLVEIIFSWPGIGFYTINSIMAMDFNAIMTTTLLVAIVYTVTNLVVDILYVAIDPRISYS